MAQAYKPSERIFRLAFERLALSPHEILHVAISPWADIEGMKPLGARVVWVNRGDDILGKWTPNSRFRDRGSRGTSRHPDALMR